MSCLPGGLSASIVGGGLDPNHTKSTEHRSKTIWNSIILIGSYGSIYWFIIIPIWPGSLCFPLSKSPERGRSLPSSSLRSLWAAWLHSSFQNLQPFAMDMRNCRWSWKDKMAQKNGTQIWRAIYLIIFQDLYLWCAFGYLWSNRILATWRVDLCKFFPWTISRSYENSILRASKQMVVWKEYAWQWTTWLQPLH